MPRFFFPSEEFRRAAFRDAALAVVVFFAAFFAGSYFETFERFSEFSRSHENWDLDEIATGLVALFVLTSLTSIRRLHESYRELARRQAAEGRANALALHDGLTGLPNRCHAEIEIANAIAGADRSPFSLLLFDLNRYKAVNDLHGHPAGDQLLRAVGKRLTEACGSDAFIGRLGGDEFIALLPGFDPSSDRLLARIEAISSAFDEPFSLNDISLTIGTSIGVTVCTDRAIEAGALVGQADAAMYRCKQRGRNGFAFFEKGMEQASIFRAKIEADLREAIGAGMIIPYYQPLVEIETGETVGFEVLARWKLPDGSLRAPDEFIGIAEETGLIGELFYSLLRQASQEVGNWPPHYRMSVNLSPVQFGDEWLVERILQILLEAGVAPGRLELEMTENAVVNEIDEARELIERLKTQGISVALDDFGTGYSSLRHLSELRFDKLKIDKSFIADIENNETSQTIVRTVTVLAHSLGLTVCVEGIETEGSAESVGEYGCDLGQGYLYGRPNAQAISHQQSVEPAKAARGKAA